MCRPARCRVCRRATWAGCGWHVESVKAAVPAGQWCDGRHSDAEREAARAGRAGAAGFFARLFGR
ncbi:hypothetical protein B6D25_06255 [Micrococcus luteus]|nr:hypothetical protein [Micrococcus luteus]KAB1902690.1 hypothetical protein F8198_03810 [Micrococcus luteus NCTC 2665]ORE61339.1 hypothetical protein B6D25_06255 [Micrococcus luteus]QCY44554.1 hypothetical protein ERB44_04915 [Micrococcus luteus]RFP73808.1 hypothetical protein D0N42_01935 [Micrococcus luteus]